MSTFGSQLLKYVAKARLLGWWGRDCVIARRQEFKSFECQLTPALEKHRAGGGPVGCDQSSPSWLRGPVHVGGASGRPLFGAVFFFAGKNTVFVHEVLQMLCGYAWYLAYCVRPLHVGLRACYHLTEAQLCFGFCWVVSGMRGGGCWCCWILGVFRLGWGCAHFVR